MSEIDTKRDLVMCSLSSTHGYPVHKLFKPVTLKMPENTRRAACFLLNRFHEINEAPVPACPHEIAYEKRMGRSGANASTFGSRSGVDMERESDWKRVGMYWVRKADGSNPGSRYTDREGHYALWRDAADSYCCAGFPYYDQPAKDKFALTFETIKPVVRGMLNGQMVTISLERDIVPPHGTCWGYSGSGITWRVDCAHPTVYRSPGVKTELKRIIYGIAGIT